jgi:putative ABC transport system permease protein
MITILSSSLEQALILLPLVLGIYLSYSILKVTDLTVDGTYVFGAALFAKTIHLGLGVALISSILGGAIVGAIVGYMQRHNKVSDLVVGILGCFMLYSVNLQFMGRPNLSTLGMPTILSYMNLENWIIPLGIVSIILASSLTFLLNSRLGLFLRAFGHNQKLLSILGKSPEKYRLIGLVISNSLAALSGSLTAQINGFADINMGFGIALVSIGAVVIGRHILIKHGGSFVASKEVISCFIGVLLYFLALNLLLNTSINPANLKFILGAILFLSLRQIRKEA